MTDQRSPTVIRGATASWFANLKTMTKVMLGVLPPLALLVALGTLAVVNINKVVDTAALVDHTRVVLAKASGIVASAVDMETGMRGYLLAGQESFLDPYRSGQAATFSGLASLRETVSDNPAQVEHLQEAEAVLREWQDNVTEMQIALRREIGDAPTMNDIAAMVGEQRGKMFFDTFRADIAAFREAERALLGERVNRFEQLLFSGAGTPAQLSEALDWVTHTHNVLDETNAVTGAAVDMETAMRGYLLAGEETFLEPYTAGQRFFAEHIATLTESVSDNPAQVARLESVAQTVDTWRSEVAEPMIELRRSIAGAKTMDDMADLVAEARGKQYFDRFRAIMVDFEVEEAALIDQRQALKEATVAQTFFTVFASIGAAIVIGLGLAWMIGRSIAVPIRNITGAMGRLAGGDTSIVIEGQARRDEVGDMARATDVFKENAIEKNRLDAEARAQAERDAAAAAERARLQDDVAAVVDRAAAGDFKSRVQARYSDEALNAFAGQLNSLIEAVASGIGETARVMEALAGGNLTATMQGSFRGAFAELQSNVNTTVGRLSETVLDIQRVSSNVSTATGEIAAGASDLSGRAENQAASLEEIAATMEQMSATVKTNAENAASAMSLATEASGRADKGGGIVSEAVVAMASIEEGSRKIADIVSVIDGFAFQTNLLALNAAVEAARAGEAGKGFAVVASEVRTLAQRSAEAARDIKGLIETSSGQVSDGVKLVEETGNALREIVESIKSVSSTVTEISEASREQSSGVDEITAALTSMDETTQQNSALADESANAARGLNDQAARLRERVSFFRVEAGGGSHANAWDDDAAADSAAAKATSRQTG